MSNINAAIGIVQLKRINEFSDKRRTLAYKYNEALECTPGISLLNVHYESVTPHIYVIKLDNRVDRSVFMANMNAAGIEVGIHYKPNHLLEFYKNRSTRDLTNISKIMDGIVSLPMHVEITDENIQYITLNIKKFI